MLSVIVEMIMFSILPASVFAQAQAPQMPQMPQAQQVPPKPEEKISLEVELTGVRDPFQPKLPEKIQTPEGKYTPDSSLPPVDQIQRAVPPPPPVDIKIPDPVSPPDGFNPDKYLPPPTFSVGNMEVTGIIWNSDRPQAIVNGKVVEKGDETSGLKIISIEKTGVVVGQSGNQKQTLLIKK